MPVFEVLARARVYLKQVPGFRTGRGWKGILASLFYGLAAIWTISALAGGYVSVAFLSMFGVAAAVVAMNGWNLRLRLPGISSSSVPRALGAWIVMLVLGFVGTGIAAGFNAPTTRAARSPAPQAAAAPSVGRPATPASTQTSTSTPPRASSPGNGATPPPASPSTSASALGSNNSSTSCRMGSEGLPDPLCTPGAANPAVTQATISQTICVSGYTTTIRPPSSYTTDLKIQQMRQYGFTGTTADYEEDHLIPLEVGGDPRDPRNLWPQPYSAPYSARQKDTVENYLHDQVCSGRLSLAEAQRQAAQNWIAVFLSIPGRTAPPAAIATFAPSSIAPTPTTVPTAAPSAAPTVAPTSEATPAPTQAPTAPTSAPTPAPTPVPTTSTTGGIVITTLFYDGVVVSTEADEYVEVRNTGDSPQSISGWRIASGRGGQSYSFPAISIQAGQTCRVYTNQNHPEWCGLNWGRGTAAWNNAGDRANLLDPQSTIVSSFGYKGY